jgi:transcriptional regulator with XRE-family HTH domain
MAGVSGKGHESAICGSASAEGVTGVHWFEVDIHEKAKELRKRTGMEQYEVSVAADISIGMARKIEQGPCRVTDKALKNIALAFGVRVVDLFNRAEIAVEDISREKADELLASKGDTYEPRGLFVVRDFVDGDEVFTAIQNLDGTAETEEFTRHRAAVNWLHGRGVSGEYYYLPDIREKTDDVKKLEKIANGGA